ncbi:hypothetical protein EDB83DRAFT_2556113 [Lactarius deliciosus]|nr:hypothetical protein EDB83DRAFT_2556113 [Lactarius deliciosus]
MSLLCSTWASSLSRKLATTATPSWRARPVTPHKTPTMPSCSRCSLCMYSWYMRSEYSTRPAICFLPLQYLARCKDSSGSGPEITLAPRHRSRHLLSLHSRLLRPRSPSALAAMDCHRHQPLRKTLPSHSKTGRVFPRLALSLSLNIPSPSHRPSPFEDVKLATPVLTASAPSRPVASVSPLSRCVNIPEVRPYRGHSKDIASRLVSPPRTASPLVSLSSSPTTLVPAIDPLRLRTHTDSAPYIVRRFARARKTHHDVALHRHNATPSRHHNTACKPPQCYNAVSTLQEIPPRRQPNTVSKSRLNASRERRQTDGQAITAMSSRRVTRRQRSQEPYTDESKTATTTATTTTASTATQSDGGYDNHTPTTSRRPRQRKACNKACACDVVGPILAPLLTPSTA